MNAREAVGLLGDGHIAEGGEQRLEPRRRYPTVLACEVFDHEAARRGDVLQRVEPLEIFDVPRERPEEPQVVVGLVVIDRRRGAARRETQVSRRGSQGLG